MHPPYAAGASRSACRPRIAMTGGLFRVADIFVDDTAMAADDRLHLAEIGVDEGEPHQYLRGKRHHRHRGRDRVGERSLCRGHRLKPRGGGWPEPAHSAIGQEAAATDTAPLTADALRAVLDQLDALLAQSDIAAIAQFEWHAAAPRAALGAPGERLGREIRQFALEATRKTVQTLHL